MAYEQVLTIYDLILGNIGFIIGAGIFVLLGKTINIAGKTAWISVIISGLVIYYISDSYIKVQQKYITNNSEYIAIKAKFGPDISNSAILITLLANIAIIYVVCLGFGSYTNALISSINPKTASILGLIIACIINIYGIELTTDINNIFTIAGIIGLLLLIFLGFRKMSISNLAFTAKDFNLGNILGGAFIFIFAYFGFELIIRLTAESTNKTSDIPNAMFYSIWCAIIIYTLITVVTIGVFGNKLNDTTHRPLSLLAEQVTNNKFIIKYIELCGIILTWNTILLSITYCSRLLAEFTKEYSHVNDIIKYIGNINTITHTPIISILIVSILVLTLILNDVNILSGTVIANTGICLVMGLVWLSARHL